MVRELPGDVRTGQFVQGGTELLLGARQVPAVDVGDRLPRDDVQLVTGVQHGRVGTVADGRLDQLGGRAELLQQPVHVREVGLDAV